MKKHDSDLHKIQNEKSSQQLKIQQIKDKISRFKGILERNDEEYLDYAAIGIESMLDTIPNLRKLGKEIVDVCSSI